ncbi:hypothetical protein NQ176_g9971 [Zarea fungicola]|uniref:Uncharacterized protein n=1 Tax=Zarea fungicola TaxID=93591 RepID=A0ACC1MJG3_9HYPO|nr:hypothetical protein NQ176_g9971 [Lecanicillium fungicola]
MSQEKQQQERLQEHVSGQANEPMSAPAHALSYADVERELKVDHAVGLTPDEAKIRLGTYGRNEFGETKGVQPLKILIGQIANALTLVLILAMAASFGIRSWIEGGVITAVILLNIVVGFFQEFKAAKTMDSLRSLSSPTAQAIRSGTNQTVVTAEIVPGDVVELKTGPPHRRIPACPQRGRLNLSRRHGSG